jgi:glutaminase
MGVEVGAAEQRVSTGCLPAWADVEELTKSAYERNRRVDTGVVADYIPKLAEANPASFGLALVEVNGGVHDAGAAEHLSSIQSISKAFVFALV